MKRIVFCVTNDLSFDQRMQRICGTLSDSGYHITIVGRLLSESSSLSNEKYNQVRLRIIFTKGKLFYLEYNIRLFLWLLLQQFDAVCAVDLDTILPALITSKIKRKKVVYDAHEYFTEVPEVVNRPIVKSIWKSIERFSLPKMDAAYTVSASIAHEFKVLYSIDCFVIRNLPKYFPVQQPEKIENSIVYQGALNVGRGLEYLIDAVQGLPVKVYLAGDGDIKEQLVKRVIANDMRDQVIFMGKLSPVDLKTFTPKFTIGFNVLQNTGKSYYYSLSNKTFDYIQAQVPQIMSDFPEMKLLNEQFNIGIIVKDCTVMEIKSAIITLLQNKLMYQSLVENCAVVGKQLCWENEETKLLNIYEQLFR